MDLAQFQAEHPTVYAQAVALGVKQGKTSERDRVTAHLILGESHDAMDTAVKAVEDGSEMTDTLKARYMAAGQNKLSLAAQASDDKDTGKAADEVKGASKGSDEANTITDQSQAGLSTLLGAAQPAA